MKKACLLGMGGVLALLLSGCTNDQDVSNAPTGQAAHGYSPPAPAALAPVPAAPDSGAQSADPLLSGAHSGGALPTADPLLPSNSPASSDPLIGSDPLKGRAMPTEHSHWLRGRMRDARLTVLLNGIRAGEYSGVVDQDITMKLRAGINSVTFLYAPRQADSSAQMDLLESEHDPPIPPLVTFQSAPVPDGATDFKPTTQSFTFFAK